ncbi:uncharacterized protein LOC107632866 [Arachis ipaensis]|uniref:uncharacterized protein LOC107632866 n=1 Tax=Arachis ipaensis TaxID=130454 RepID=UPI0007AF4165|nr:uncharacterized protein LOC107632866 [Arachis ipaensis]
MTPMISSLRLIANAGTPFENPTLYRSIVGGLQYATITRPDISFSVNKLSQFMSNPCQEHWVAVKRVLRYLAGTAELKLQFHRCTDLRFSAFSDSDWASDLDDRKSTTGFCVYYSSNLVSWKSSKQPTVSRSSTEAEYRALAAVFMELIWIQNLLAELHQPCPASPTVFCDNISAVLLAYNPILHNRTKHFELDLYFILDKVIKGSIAVTHIPSTEQVADVLTKPLSLASFNKFKSKLRLAFKPP